YSIAFSRDGKYLVSAVMAYGLDCVIKFWDLSTGQVVRNFTHKQVSARSVSLSWDGQRLAIVGKSDVSILDTATGQPVGASLQHPKQAISLGSSKPVWSPDGNSLVVAYSIQRPDPRQVNRQQIVVWDTRTSQPIQTLGLKDDYFLTLDSLV